MNKSGWFIIFILLAFVFNSFASADIKIEQESSGFSGSEQKTKKELTKQVLLLKNDKLKLENLEEPVICIVRLDKKLIWEINKTEKTYVERHFSYFRELRKNKASQRNQVIRELNGYEPEKRTKEAKELGFRLLENGKVDPDIMAQTIRTEEKKEIAGYECSHVIIKEDENVALDLWLTDKIKAPDTDNLIRFYEELGIFSSEVIEEMKKIKEIPLELNMKIDAGSLSFSVFAVAKKIDTSADIKEKEFELPEGLKKIKEISAEGEKDFGEFPCLICGKKVDLQDKINTYRYVHKGLTYIFCCAEHRKEFIKLLLKHNGKTDFLKPIDKEEKK
ncbi:MAG: DUF4412 domain-containing protein [Planctomycetota bacterium]